MTRCSILTRTKGIKRSCSCVSLICSRDRSCSTKCHPRRCLSGLRRSLRHQSHGHADDLPDYLRFARQTECSRGRFRARMRDDGEVRTNHLTPRADVSISQLDQIDRAAVFVVPSTARNPPSRFINHDNRSGPQQGDHGVIFHANISVHVLLILAWKMTP